MCWTDRNKENLFVIKAWRKQETWKVRRKPMIRWRNNSYQVLSGFYTQRGERRGRRIRATRSSSLCFSSTTRTAGMRITEQTRKQGQMFLTRRQLFHWSRSRSWRGGISAAAAEVSGACAATAADASATSAASSLTRTLCSSVTTHCARTAWTASCGGPRTRGSCSAPSVGRPPRSPSGRSGDCRRSS